MADGFRVFAANRGNVLDDLDDRERVIALSAPALGRNIRCISFREDARERYGLDDPVVFAGEGYYRREGDREDVDQDDWRLLRLDLLKDRNSRIERFAQEIQDQVPAGNIYVNRSMIGAVVGVQPFGGVGLSGTGPKAGGPHALLRFANERAISVNIMAQGGDPALLSL